MLNTKKSTEIIIRKPGSKDANLPPPPIQGIHRVSQMVVLGVTFFALKVLKSHGLGGNTLWDVTQATLINKLLYYASPVWWGFMDASDKQRLQSIITKAVRLGLMPISQALLSELCEHADLALFSNIVNNQNHVLHNLLPPLKITGHDLRKPTRDRTLPSKEDNSLFWKTFIHRLSTNNYFYSKP